MVQAQHVDACDLPDHGFHVRPRRFDQVGPHLLEQVPPFSAGSALSSCCSAAVNTPWRRATSVVDDQWTVLGSSNLDARSLRWNLEFLAVVRSIPLAAAVAGIIRDEIKQSQRMTLRTYARRGRWERFLDLLAWGLRWCL
jgi:PLD-like domain